MNRRRFSNKQTKVKKFQWLSWLVVKQASIAEPPCRLLYLCYLICLDPQCEECRLALYRHHIHRRLAANWSWLSRALNNRARSGQPKTIEWLGKIELDRDHEPGANYQTCPRAVSARLELGAARRRWEDWGVHISVIVCWHRASHSREGRSVLMHTTHRSFSHRSLYSLSSLLFMTGSHCIRLCENHRENHSTYWLINAYMVGMDVLPALPHKLSMLVIGGGIKQA